MEIFKKISKIYNCINIAAYTLLCLTLASFLVTLSVTLWFGNDIFKTPFVSVLYVSLGLIIVTGVLFICSAVCGKIHIKISKSIYAKEQPKIYQDELIKEYNHAKKIH